MRIAGNTIRRNYLSRYEKNYGDKYDSEKKIYSGRQFDRGSENPINAARALRIRRSQAEVETYKDNLKTADSIYTNAETSMLTVSSIIQNVYEKLVEGAHGTRNQDDLNIIAMEIDNYAEEMVQSLNIDIADRKVFGGLNNDTVAFKIESSATGTDKYVTYNGVALNSSNDPTTFPYNGVSYLDIGIGMANDESIDRIDDQTALPITFNGAECTGCGMTRATAAIDLKYLTAGKSYSFDIYAGGKTKTIEFTAGTSVDDTITVINDKLKEEFNMAPELNDDNYLLRLDDYKMYSYSNLPMYEGNLSIGQLEADSYYSMKVTVDNKTRVVNFRGGADLNERLSNIGTALKDAFNSNNIHIDGSGAIHLGKVKAEISPNITIDDTKPVTFGTATDPDGNVKQTVTNLAGLTPGEQYAINVCTPKLDANGKPVTDESGNTVYNNGEMIYFTAGEDEAETKQIINDYIINNEIFGEAKVPYINETGTFVYDVDGAHIMVNENPHSQNSLSEYISEIKGYPKNIVQLVLDAGKLLREGDQDMVARYADLIYAAQSNLSIAITDLGTHSKFIEFNEDRLSEIEIKLNERQNDIESTDLPTEITKWKVLESVYNASLQMGSSVLSQSIFNYIS
ncbi:MAG: hypothetical protein IJT87_06535 [Ruminiclostridium sp.]|nr:hypothetical protein [Ruminiclostridium sp.]